MYKVFKRTPFNALKIYHIKMVSTGPDDSNKLFIKNTTSSTEL